MRTLRLKENYWLSPKFRMRRDYPNCNYTATVEVHQILDGESIPEKAVLVLCGFRERQFTPEAAFQKGTLFRAQIRKFDEMPQSVQALHDR